MLSRWRKTELLLAVVACGAVVLCLAGCREETADTAGPWIRLDKNGDMPSGRYMQAMARDPTTGNVFLFGGWDSEHGEPLNDTWAYDPAANTWTELRPTGELPPARCGHALVYEEVDNRLILFAGQGSRGHQLNDTWAYDPAANTWTELHPTGELPRAREHHGMAYDPAVGRLILFGGYSFDTSSLGDTWAYDPAANRWSELHPAGDAAPRRSGHSMTYDLTTGTMIVFGGVRGDPWSQGLNETWAYDAAANRWTNLHPEGDLPQARSRHSVVYEPGTGRLILFGGAEPSIRRFQLDPGKWSTFPDWAYPADSWAYDAATNKWSQLTLTGDLPSARCSSSMVWDSASGRLVLFGGYDPRTDEPERPARTWVYAPSTQ